jgi:hypothetical protein
MKNWNIVFLGFKDINMQNEVDTLKEKTTRKVKIEELVRHLGFDYFFVGVIK